MTQSLMPEATESLPPVALAPVIAKAPPPNRLSVSVLVPAGHALPLGETVKDHFSLTVEAGVRWHPDWEAPRIAVTAARFLPMGDALCWSGPAALAWPLPEPIKALALLHGQPLTDEGLALVADMGLSVPGQREKIGAFILTRALTRH